MGRDAGGGDEDHRDRWAADSSLCCGRVRRKVLSSSSLIGLTMFEVAEDGAGGGKIIGVMSSSAQASANGMAPSAPVTARCIGDGRRRRATKRGVEDPAA